MSETKQNSDKYFFRKIHSKVGKAIHHYQLISENDTVVVGLSGGKDSLSLLDILAGRNKYSGIGCQLVAVHVDIRSVPYEVDCNYLSDFCHSIGVPFHVISVDLPDIENDERQMCFVCSWNRRKILFEKVKELGCRKIALGHHKDDAVETLLMNMAFQGSICSMPAKLSMFQNEVEIIRPLIYLTDQELVEYAFRKQFSSEIKKCPFENDSKRKEMQDIIQLLKKRNPEAVNNIFASMGNIQQEYLP